MTDMTYNQSFGCTLVKHGLCTPCVAVVVYSPPTAQPTVSSYDLLLISRHNRPRLCHSFLLLGRLTLRGAHKAYPRRRLTGLIKATKTEDNVVDQVKPKVFNLIVSFNMFNWNNFADYVSDTKLNFIMPSYFYQSKSALT